MQGFSVDPARKNNAILAMITTAAWTAFFAISMMAAGAQDSPNQAGSAETMTATALQGGMHLNSRREQVEITFCSSEVLHVIARPSDAPAYSAKPEPWIAAPCGTFAAKVEITAKTAKASTTALSVAVNLMTGAITIADASGKVLLQENEIEPRRYKAVTVGGEHLYQVSDRFLPQMEEGLYGLGQHQAGTFNYRGSVVELAQANSDIAVPLLLSTNGYGLFWNTASKSFFDDRFSREVKWSADAADAVDFYFFYGPEMDRVIHHYRDLTGHAPLFGKWAYGFVQSKDRYTSAQQLLDIAGQYRAQHVPLDLIVQDWFWWKRQGDPEFTEAYLKPHPDVPGAIRQLHDEHVHTIISVWAVFDPASENYRAMLQQHLTIPGTPDYDPTNPKARDFYWDHLAGKLFDQGWDGFWLDSSEPETWKGESDAVLDDKQLFLGSGARYLNSFPLMHTGNIYDHWRQATKEKRAFLLTRSAFAGQQRNAAVEWSGDIYGTFPVLRRQIAAGLNFALSGMPYWTTDVAGYTSPFPDEPNNPQYQELYTRWFEFGTFCPILRTHGHRSSNELFSYGPQASTLIAYDKLRSRLMPYTYSLAWKVTHEDYTIMRPLVMDWRNDVKARPIDDQFMFGPALMVNPVTVAGATERLVYLPPAAAWYDFWTGEKLAGSRQILSPAPLDRIPLYVPAGTLLPLGPEQEYAGQQPDAPIELRIYPGADGHFDLYDDEGDSYRYESGAHAVIPLQWNDATKTLTIAAREGHFPGMPQHITFHVSMVGQNSGTGISASSVFQTVQYSGRRMTAQINSSEGAARASK